MDLEGRDTVQGSGGSPDLRGEVRHRGQVVADHGGGIGEPVAGQLHAVTGVACKPHHDALLLYDGFLGQSRSY